MLELYVKLQTVLHAMKEEDGQDLVEYALLGALIAVVCVSAVSGLATAIKTQLAAIAAAI